jgi:hypothetical protein
MPSVVAVTSFLIESYTPAATQLTDTQARLRDAAAGTAVRYVRSIFVPDDEICFHLVYAPSVASADVLLRAAGIVAQRIMEVRE